jgi:hypothetical protein
MNIDGVAAAFELIVEEIEAVAQDIADQGSDAFKNKDYEKAQILGESGKNLQVFLERVSALLADWQAGIDIDTRKRFPSITKQNKSKKNSKNSRASNTRLRVTLPNGEVIEDPVAAKTFALAIIALGVDKVRQLGHIINKIPLIDSVKHDRYYQTEIDGWYICTSLNTKKKERLLKKIARELGTQIWVEIK